LRLRLTLLPCCGRLIRLIGRIGRIGRSTLAANGRIREAGVASEAKSLRPRCLPRKPLDAHPGDAHDLEVRVRRNGLRDAQRLAQSEGQAVGQ